jgi:hypothetical protein
MTGYLRVTHPCATLLRTEVPFAFDLHVLSTPPAFVLSQDQTLQFYILANHNKKMIGLIQINAKYVSVLFGPLYYCSVFKDQCYGAYAVRFSAVQKSILLLFSLPVKQNSYMG